MSFIKKNYEKVLLGAVLLGLVAFLLFGQVIVAREKQALEDEKNGVIRQAPKALPELVMSREENILNRVQSQFALDFETTNRLFNTMQWQREPNGRIIKISNGNIVGPRAVKVTNIRPLNFILHFDSFEPAGQSGPARYQLSIEHEGATNPFDRRAKKHFLSPGQKELGKEPLLLLSVSGPPDKPQLTVEMLETGEKVTVTLDKPYQEVESYEADLTYAPETKHWNNQRVGALLKFNNNNYNIVVIDQNEVVISAESNQKRTTLPYQP